MAFADGHAHLLDATRLAAAQVERANEQAIIVSRTMALAQQYGLFGSRKALVTYAEAVVRSVPGVLAAYVAYEPDADGHDRASLGDPELSRAIDADGRFLPYVVRRDPSDPNEVTVEPLRAMETSLYYRGVRNRFHLRPETEGVEMTGGVSRTWVEPAPSEALRTATMITEPYEYFGLHIVEQTHPIVVGGAFAGIVGVDRSLASIVALVDAYLPWPEADAILVSARGRVVAATADPSIVMHTIESTPWADALSEAHAGSAEELARAGVRTVADPRGGEPRLVAADRLAESGWTLVMTVPVSVAARGA